MKPETAMRRAATICDRVARSWQKEAIRRINGKGDSDDCTEATAMGLGARECARRIRAEADKIEDEQK